MTTKAHGTGACSTCTVPSKELNSRLCASCAGVTQESAFGVQANALEDPTSELRIVRENSVTAVKAIGKIGLMPWKAWFWCESMAAP